MAISRSSLRIHSTDQLQGGPQLPRSTLDIVRAGQRPERHDAVVVEIVYALLTSMALGALVGLGVYAVAWTLGIENSQPTQIAAVALALLVWGLGTLVLLVRFDVAGRT